MVPTPETRKQWHQSMLTAQALITILQKDMERLNPLLQGLVFMAFRNPLLSIVTVNGMPCIAHTTPLGISVLGMDNPLENTASTGDHRATIGNENTSLLIEQNMGPRHKDPLERALEKACTDAGDEMTRTGDFLRRRGQQFSTLCYATMPSHGSAFEWKQVAIHELSTFRSIKFVEKELNAYRGMPAFDLILAS